MKNASHNIISQKLSFEHGLKDLKKDGIIRLEGKISLKNHKEVNYVIKDCSRKSWNWQNNILL